MKPILKVAVVAVGYFAAFLVASAAVGIRLANTSGPDGQASSGMYAFGDALLFVAAFGVVALVPTGAALFFLRPYRHFWQVLSAFSLARSSPPEGAQVRTISAKAVEVAAPY
jgi:hypothetical protein